MTVLKIEGVRRIPSIPAQLDDLLEWLEYDAEDADMDALVERVATLKADFGVVVK